MCGEILNRETAAVYEKPENSGGKKGWINVGKIIAMAAVLTDHAYQILYTNRKVAYASWFSVTLFLFLSGAVQYLAFERHKDRLAYTKRRVWQFAVSYAVVVAVYLLAAYRCFNAGTWLNALVHFNIIDAFYFVCFFYSFCLFLRCSMELSNAWKAEVLRHGDVYGIYCMFWFFCYCLIFL